MHHAGCMHAQQQMRKQARTCRMLASLVHDASCMSTCSSYPEDRLHVKARVSQSSVAVPCPEIVAAQCLLAGQPDAAARALASRGDINSILAACELLLLAYTSRESSHQNIISSSSSLVNRDPHAGLFGDDDKAGRSLPIQGARLLLRACVPAARVTVAAGSCAGEPRGLCSGSSRHPGQLQATEGQQHHQQKLYQLITAWAAALLPAPAHGPASISTTTAGNSSCTGTPATDSGTVGAGAAVLVSACYCVALRGLATWCECIRSGRVPGSRSWAQVTGEGPRQENQNHLQAAEAAFSWAGLLQEFSSAASDEAACSATAPHGGLSTSEWLGKLPLVLQQEWDLLPATVRDLHQEYQAWHQRQQQQQQQQPSGRVQALDDSKASLEALTMQPAALHAIDAGGQAPGVTEGRGALEVNLLHLAAISLTRLYVHCGGHGFTGAAAQPASGATRTSSHMHTSSGADAGKDTVAAAKRALLELLAVAAPAWACSDAVQCVPNVQLRRYSRAELLFVRQGMLRQAAAAGGATAATAACASHAQAATPAYPAYVAGNSTCRSLSEQAPAIGSAPTTTCLMPEPPAPLTAARNAARAFCMLPAHVVEALPAEVLLSAVKAGNE